MITIFTHSGSFHSDEVFAVAVIKLWLNKTSRDLQEKINEKEKEGENEVKICRTRDQKLMTHKQSEDFVLDVGFIYNPTERRFDHHQPSAAGSRENESSIPYATFGLVWKEYGVEICGDKAAERIDQKLAAPIDAIDNGIELFTKIHEQVKPYTIDNIILSFKPTWQEKEVEMDDCFNRALTVAEQVLDREIIKAQAFTEGKKMVEKAYDEAEDKRIIVLENNYSWGDVLQEKPEPLFIVMNNGQQTTWAVSTINEQGSSFKSRKLFPEAWAGKTGSELAAASGVRDANFCHNGRFIAIANSKEGALRLARLAVEA